MKHPNHGVVALILTENPDGDCPEFDVEVEGKVMSCKIHGVPGVKWYIGCYFDKPGPAATTQCIYYTYESYLEGTRMDGPLEIDRRLQSSRTRLSPSRSSNLEMFFFLPARSDGKHVNGCFEPRNWLIELKVYESDEYFDFPETGQLSSARSVILGRRGVFPKFNKLRYKGTERLIVHYKWQYHCVNLVLELHPGRHEGRTPKSITEQATTEEPPTPMLLDSSVLNSLEERPEPLPEYSWGPQSKNPPAWEQKGRGFTRLGVRAEKSRSYLGERVYNTKGLSIRLRRPVALQKAKIRGERPMLPIAPPSQLMRHLPVGWELRYTNTWKVYYVNHKDGYTTWRNPLVKEPSVPEKDHSDRGREVWPRGGRQPRTPTRLQQMDGAMELLCKERAHAEAGIQMLRLGHTHPGEWKDTHIEHWFPEDKASKPIIEHIDTHTTDPILLWRAFRIRDKTIIKMETLEKERGELEESMSSSLLSRLTSKGESTSECDEKNRRKKRSSEELEENDCSEVQTGGGHDGGIDYREDYGPEVPVTRDGKIDPDWHRDKIAKFRRETSRSNFLDEHNKDSPSCQEDPVPILITDSPLDYDMESDDYQPQEALKQLLQQYDINLKKQAYKPSTNEPSRKSSTEELSEYDLKGYGPPWRKASQKLSSEGNDPNDYNMETNEEPEHSMSRQMSKLLTEDGLIDHDMVCESEPDASTLADVTESNNTNISICIDNREDLDNPISTEVYQSSGVEDHDTGNDNELYAPPPWYWLVKFGQMRQSPPRPVLVLREGLQAANSNNVTAALGQAPNEQRVYDEPMIVPSGFQDVVPAASVISRTSTQDVVPAASVISRTSTLAVVVSAQVLKDDLAKLTVDSSDGGPADEPDSTTSTSTPTVDSETGSCEAALAGESDPTSSGSKSKKNRRKSNRISDLGGGESSTSIISSERHYNLRKRNSKS